MKIQESQNEVSQNLRTNLITSNQSILTTANDFSTPYIVKAR